MINWVELSHGSSCLVGRVVSWVELSRGSSFLWVELSRGSSCHEGQVDTNFMRKFMKFCQTKAQSILIVCTKYKNELSGN